MIHIQERNISRTFKFTNSELNCMLPKFLPKCLLPLKVQKSGCPDPQFQVLVPNVPLNLHLSRILVADARIQVEAVHSRSPPPLQYGSHRAPPRAWFSGSHILHLPPLLSKMGAPITHQGACTGPNLHLHSSCICSRLVHTYCILMHHLPASP